MLGTTVGDVVGAVTCIDDMCNIGKASIDLMNSTFQALDAVTQQSFSQAVQALNDQFNATYSWYSSYIPFNPTCCTVLDIGQQADALTLKMNPALGQGPSQKAAGAVPGSGIDWQGYVVLGLIGLFAYHTLVKKGYL